MGIRTAMIVVVAAWCGAAGAAPSSRPASDAERRAAGFDDPQTPLTVRESESAGAPDRRAPEGIIGARHQTRIGTAFSGRSSSFDFAGEPPSISCATGTAEKFASANLDLPDQAQIRYVDVFGYDNSPGEDLRVFLISLCQATLASGPPEYQLLGDVATSGTAGDTLATINLSATPVVVDRFSCQYLARVSMGTTPGGTCVGSAIFLDKVRVEYTQP